MSRAVLLFHQGWADIFNSLPLINYYASKYSSLTVLIRSDSAPIVEYYTKNMAGVHIDYQDLSFIDMNKNRLVEMYADCDLLFIGLHDYLRKDDYRASFSNNYQSMFFVEKFYACYGVDYVNRIHCFDLPRNLEVENNTYKDFVAEYGKEYVIFHEDPERGLVIDKSKVPIDIPWVNVNQRSKIIFDYVQVLAHAKEVHMIDSTWAAAAYQIDTKYSLFKHIPIHIHCIRGYRDMFIHPLKLSNWDII